MRRFIAIILLGGILTHLFYSSGLLIDYYANLEMYKELCENKEMPQLKCDGKCILAEKIAAANKERSQNNSTVPPIPLINLQYLTSTFQINFNTTASLIVHQRMWLDPFSKKVVFDIFKPPI